MEGVPTDVTSVDFVADAHESATLRIADLLRHPDDLTTKFPLARRKIAMERASIEAQLKTVMESQLDGTQKGIDSLRNCRTTTQNIKEALQNLDGLCSDSQNTIKNYNHIRKVFLVTLLNYILLYMKCINSNEHFALVSLDFKNAPELCCDEADGGAIQRHKQPDFSSTDTS